MWAKKQEKDGLWSLHMMMGRDVVVIAFRHLGDWFVLCFVNTNTYIGHSYELLRFTSPLTPLVTSVTGMSR